MATVGKKLVVLLLQRERKENVARVRAGIKQKRVTRNIFQLRRRKNTKPNKRYI